MKRNAYIMYALSFLQGMVFYAPVATLYRQARGLNIAQITLIEGISLAVTLAMEFPWGAAADRIGYRRTMLVCNGLFFASKLIFWRARGFGAFLLERVVLAVTVAGLSGVDSSILYLSVGADGAQRAFSISENLGTLGLLTASAVTALLPDDFSLLGLLTVVSYGAALLLTFGLVEVRSPRPAERRERGALRRMLGGMAGDKGLLCLLAAAALGMETLHTVTTFLNQPQYLRCGMTNGQIAAVYIGATLVGLLGILSDRGTRRFGARRFGCALLAASALACATLTATGTAWLSVAAVLTLTACAGLLSPLFTQEQNLRVKTDDRATELSMNAVLVDGASVFISILLGAAAERGVALGMTLAAVLCALALAFFAAGMGFRRAARSGQ